MLSYDKNIGTKQYDSNILIRAFEYFVTSQSLYVVSLKGIQSDKVVLEWKGTFNTFVE